MEFTQKGGQSRFLYSRGYRALITHSVLELLEESSKLQSEFKGFLDQGKIDSTSAPTTPTFIPQGFRISTTPRRWPKGA